MNDKYNRIMRENLKVKTDVLSTNQSLYSEIFHNDSSYNSPPEILKDPVYAGPLNFVLAGNYKSVVDIGSGRGNFINLLLNYNPDIEIISCDLQKFNDIPITFIPVDLTGDLTSISDLRADVLTCTGVLEHIPLDCLPEVFRVFSMIAPYASFTIANHQDRYKGVDIHITNMALEDWIPIIDEYYEIINTQKYYKDNKLFLINVRSKYVSV
jgi:hypothetical protein